MRLVSHMRTYLSRYDLSVPEFLNSDRDAKERWANSVTSGAWNIGLGGFGGQIIGGVVKKSVGRVFG